ncbi:hypothetical protein BV898_09931 [Hypsibius exemplaris]|uniref:DOMON domain-containing protein n=1 Tax=Hypsibius exemplaris TaxID=2072580 RepID=A0A1W0WLC6_HYPEX|nr:hypothetical protein BV898_09931 [Hypsibius exemplaris]
MLLNSFLYFAWLTITLPVVVWGLQELAAGCGKNGKHCISRPPDCLSDPKLCTQIATVTPAASGVVHVHIKAKGSRLKNRWIGLGFSEDDNMGNDAVIVCFHNETTTAAELSYNQDHFNLGSAGVDQKYLHPTKTKGEDDTIHCSLDLYKKLSVKEHEFDLSKPHYFLFSSGPLKTGRIAKHDKLPIVSIEPYVFP